MYIYNVNMTNKNNIDYNNEIEKQDDDEILDDDLSDELNNEYENELTSQYMTDELQNDEDTINDLYYNEDYNMNKIKKEFLYNNDRISKNRLTKYELVRILGERVKQLSMGAQPVIKNYKDFSYEKIAEYELITDNLPFKIKRPIPNGKFEIWYLHELKKDHLNDYLEHYQL